MFLSSLLLVLGGRTLLLARRAALIENDGKKVVALSTLRQLGLIFIALSLGNRIVCLFHLLIHAFAKANLFLMVGDFLHMRFSQQDSRQLSSGVERGRIFLIIAVSIVRLRGVVFIRGFFSKDSILSREFSLMRSLLVCMVLVGTISLTLAYCLKLLISLVVMEGVNIMTHLSYNPLSVFPRMLLVAFSICLGHVLFNNLSYLIPFSIGTSTGFNWIYLIIRFPLLVIGIIVSPFKSGSWFIGQVKMVKVCTALLLTVLKKNRSCFLLLF